MAKRRSTKEQLDELIVKQEEMKAKEKALKKKLALEERKARTRRLIGVGAEVESVYGKPITEEMLPLLRKFLLDQENRGSFLTKALEKETDANEK
jgi:predicted Holliday junction resolvase-like endonuclease